MSYYFCQISLHGEIQKAQEKNDKVLYDVEDLKVCSYNAHAALLAIIPKLVVSMCALSGFS